MSKQIEKFANNQNTKFAKLVKKLCIKHCYFIPKSAPQPANFSKFQTEMYTHRVLFAYFNSLSTPSIANNTHFQAHFVKIMRRNTNTLVAIANTPTNFMPK